MAAIGQILRQVRDEMPRGAGTCDGEIADFNDAIADFEQAGSCFQHAFYRLIEIGFQIELFFCGIAKAARRHDFAAAIKRGEMRHKLSNAGAISAEESAADKLLD